MGDPREPTPEQQAAQEAGDGTIVHDPDVVGDLHDDGDSSADVESLRESTASISSSILEYRNINGRKYQSSKTTEYWAPTDEKHVEGMDIAHQFSCMLMDEQLTMAPIGEDPQRILDIGTGTGIWAIDAADEWPSAEVIGTDISAVQPGWVPPNCVFQIDDAQLDWTFREDYFDLVHTRYLYGAIDDWPRFYEQAYRHTRPGGWFEHVDFDLETRSENPNAPQAIVDTFRKWANLFFDAGRRAGRTFEFPREGRMEKQLAEAGFVDIEHRTWKLPIGGWPRDPRLKKIGMYNGMYIDQSLDGFAVYPIGETLGWTADEVTVLVSQMRAAIRDPKALPYFIVHVAWGRKPEKQ